MALAVPPSYLNFHKILVCRDIEVDTGQYPLLQNPNTLGKGCGHHQEQHILCLVATDESEKAKSDQKTPRIYYIYTPKVV